LYGCLKDKIDKGQTCVEADDLPFIYCKGLMNPKSNKIFDLDEYRTCLETRFNILHIYENDGSVKRYEFCIDLYITKLN